MVVTSQAAGTHLFQHWETIAAPFLNAAKKLPQDG
jgi:hypothetical protein